MPRGGNDVRVLKDSGGTAISAVAKTATFNSQKINLADCDKVGIVVDANTVSGTSPTMDIKGQMSFDDGTTWLDTWPAAENSETQWSLTQITAAKETAKFVPNWIPAKPAFSSSGIVPRFRFVFTIGGTNPSFTMTVYLIKRTFEGA